MNGSLNINLERLISNLMIYYSDERPGTSQSRRSLSPRPGSSAAGKYIIYI